MILALAMQLPSVANLRDHWATKARRTKAQRLSVALSMRTHPDLKKHRAAVGAGEVLKVTLVRVAPRALDDDNLQGAFKAVRDQVAKELGTTDSPKAPLRWAYQQLKPDASGASPGVMIIVGALS